MAKSARCAPNELAVAMCVRMRSARCGDLLVAGKCNYHGRRLWFCEYLWSGAVAFFGITNIFRFMICKKSNLLADAFPFGVFNCRQQAAGSRRFRSEMIIIISSLRSLGFNRSSSDFESIFPRSDVSLSVIIGCGCIEQTHQLSNTNAHAERERETCS